MAERGGVEPPDGETRQRFSRPPPSATQPSLRESIKYTLFPSDFQVKKHFRRGFSLFYVRIHVFSLIFPLLKSVHSITLQEKFLKESFMLQILVATSNTHKVAEFQNAVSLILPDLKIVTPKEFPNYPEIEETGTTFEENAQLKAVGASAFADMPAFADDSGLEVAALDGRPGIYSSRYAGDDATDAQRIEKLLGELEGKENRRARFVCVIALACRGEIFQTFRGEVNGIIAPAPRGDQGFGYDPVFIPDGYDRSFAELGIEVKDKISHRAVAFKKMMDFISEELKNLEGFQFE